MNSIFDMIILGVGIYLLYSVKQMQKTGEISTMLVNEDELVKCKDKKGFIASIQKQMTVFGMVASVYGVYRCIDMFVFSFGRVLNIAGVIIFVVTWLWFMVEFGKVKSKYFY